MSLLDRLSGVDDENKLPVHQFFSSLVLFANGSLTEQALKDEWGTNSGTDLTEWNAIRDSYLAARTPVYGGLFQDSVQPVQVVANNTVSALTALEGANAMASSGMTVDTVNGNIVLPFVGDYLLTWQLSFSGTANTTYEVAMYGGASTEVDGTKAIRRIGAGGDVGSVSGSALASTPATNVPVNLRIVHSAGSDRDVTVHAVQVSAYSMQSDNRDRWLETLHAVFMLAEQDLFDMPTKATANAAMVAAE